MIMESPYEPVRQTVYYIGDKDYAPSLYIKLNPGVTTEEALNTVRAVIHRVIPSAPFDYKFADAEYDRKFATEQRIGKLAGFFALFAIFISCLGIFGMASFMAEQRTKEIGVRKVLGASVFTIWRLLSKEFVVLVGLSILIASPIAWLIMQGWLRNYSYHATIPWWVFAGTGVGALLITLLTVSVQSVKAAMANPVKSLKAE
jgi:ABC-type antimicrobial peptide transport system permease subunit